MKKLLLYMIFLLFTPDLLANSLKNPKDTKNENDKDLVLFPKNNTERDKLLDTLQNIEDLPPLPPRNPQHIDNRAKDKNSYRRYEGDPTPSDWFYNNPFIMRDYYDGGVKPR
ncbi:hypothetical protein CQA53_01290 [Helicobacter didelphidarum]|uniref:Uncharacterized protein n=1 Tax=Helicobacter didelphidarum TaxID=2040648 RepID=A0A3D8ISP7_9HELI|nr:hypothetical protein [Helicobacter didelphidarum]RDU67664.1 hypothetical protein CQA53_01290 [Helicobacter didelphidarum]